MLRGREEGLRLHQVADQEVSLQLERVSVLTHCRGQRFTPNFRAKSDVYVAFDPDDNADDLQWEFDLYSCSADVVSSRVGGPGMLTPSSPFPQLTLQVLNIKVRFTLTYRRAMSDHGSIL